MKKNKNNRYNQKKDDLVIEIGHLEDGAIDNLISKYPDGWSECDIKNHSYTVLELNEIELPIEGNHFSLIIPKRLSNACTEALSELACKYDLRFLHNSYGNIYFFATNASYDTVKAYFEIMLKLDVCSKT